MKKLIIIFFICIFIIQVKAENDLLPNAKSGILIEPTTKTIIYEKNAYDEVSIASLTKMMGLILIFEKIDNGDIHYDDIVTISKNAQDMGGSQIWLEAGEEMSVEDLIKGIIMASANDGIVAMAEYIGGSEENFVKMMNDKAKTLGLRNTHFVNPTGLDEKGHYSSSYDVAMIATELIKHSDVFKFTTLYEDYLRKNTDRKFWLVNTNKLIKSYKGADGLKTGMTDNAGYCMAVTAKRGELRLLAVVLGEKEGKIRNQETMELLDYGFNNYAVEKIKNQGDIITSVTFDKSTPNKINAIIENDVFILQKKGEKKEKISSEIKLNNIKLPVKKGEVIGKLLIKNSSINQEVNLISDENMSKISFFKLWSNILFSMLIGN